jgi:large subunit ribosomal protein L22
MSKGHRSQIKRERNAVKDTRPSAKLSNARISASKAAFVLDAIRGKDANTALAIVTYNPRYGSELITKLLKSAIANAENNLSMDRGSLYVAEVYANPGPTLKRYVARSRGSASPMLRRTSHITIVLDQK